MNEALTMISATLAAVVGLAIVSVLVSQKAQTGNVLTSAGTAFSGVISAAVQPVSGGSNGIVNSGISVLPSITGGGLGVIQT